MYDLAVIAVMSGDCVNGNSDSATGDAKTLYAP